MRAASWLLSTLAILVALPTIAEAQAPRRFKLDSFDIQFGFANVPFAADMKATKIGLWSPVLCKFTEDPQGKIEIKPGLDGSITGELLIETIDNDGCLTTYPRKFSFGPGEPMHVLSYAKVANSIGEVRVKVKLGRNETLANSTTYQAAEGGHHLYLALGDPLRDLHDGLRRVENQNVQIVTDNQVQHVVHENDPRNLPDQWFGYNAVDLVILATSNEKLLSKLTAGDQQSSPQLAALAEWVRRGGRLVISVSPTHREKVHRLLNSSAWKPALPAVLPLDSATFPMPALEGIRDWANYKSTKLKADLKAKDKGKDNENLGVRLSESPLVAVLARETLDGKNSTPLIVRFPHGTGSITLIAFDVRDTLITDWPGKHSFWRKTIDKLAPRTTSVPAQDVNPAVIGNQGFQDFGGYRADLASGLYDQLENFDVPTVSFGWVLLFILVYIIVVGPLDFIILKMVFKRLELTWLTFPAVVLTVSLLAYFTAYAIKGQDLKVNKLDLVDIDMRTSLNGDFQPAAATAYGHTWFSILSPRIQNYTIGIEPVLQDWQAGAAATSPPIEPILSWFGRPDYGGFGGRSGASGFLNRSYQFEPNAVGLRGVPIPVWSTRTFTAAWSAELDKNKLPLESNLTYVPKQANSISGTIKNQLPFNLTDVALVYRGNYYPLADIAKGAASKIKIEPSAGKQMTEWALRSPIYQFQQNAWRDDSNSRAGTYFNPKHPLRAFLFFEKWDTSNTFRNQSHRPLDWSWRLDYQVEDGRVLDIILVARIGRAQGALEQLHADHDVKLPTHLWLGALPGTPVSGKTQTITRPDGKTETVPVYEPRPSMQGSLIQETYVRFALPIAPRK